MLNGSTPFIFKTMAFLYPQKVETMQYSMFNVFFLLLFFFLDVEMPFGKEMAFKDLT